MTREDRQYPRQPENSFLGWKKHLIMYTISKGYSAAKLPKDEKLMVHWKSGSSYIAVAALYCA